MSAALAAPAARIAPQALAYAQRRRAERRPVVFDLGCGGRKTPEAFGVDAVELPGVDLVHDLRSQPYPLPGGRADEIVLHHVLEHFADPLPLLEEAWRLCRPGGVVRIRTPHYSGCYAWKDPTHRRAFSSESFHYFGENQYSYYTSARFAVRQVRLRYLMEEEQWPRLQRAFGRCVQRLLDAHPTFGERFLAYLVGGIDELRVTLEAVKPADGAATPPG
ncbi:MAG: methyltransferase domain-containing protein [Vicinamibacteria bacterium]